WHVHHCVHFDLVTVSRVEVHGQRSPGREIAEDGLLYDPIVSLVALAVDRPHAEITVRDRRPSNRRPEEVAVVRIDGSCLLHADPALTPYGCVRGARSSIILG